MLSAWYRTLDTAVVEFVAISADADRRAAVEFIEPFGVPFPWFYAGPDIQDAFGFIGLPYTLIVDPGGRIVESLYGFGSVEEWERLQRTLEAQLPRDVAGEGPSAGEEPP